MSSKNITHSLTSITVLNVLTIVLEQARLEKSRLNYFFELSFGFQSVLHIGKSGTWIGFLVILLEVHIVSSLGLGIF